MSTEMQQLQHIQTLQHLPLPLLEAVAQHTQLLKKKRRHIFFEQGDAIDGIYVVTSGIIKLYRQSSDRSQILGLLAQGDFFGVEVLSELRTSYAAAAVTPVDVLLLPLDVIQTWMKSHAEFRDVMLHLVTHQLRQLAGVVHNLAFRDVTSRLAVVLVQLAEIQGERHSEHISIPRVLTQVELAEMVGTAREVIHRTLNRFTDDLLVRVESNHIVILDFDRLVTIAIEETR